MKKINYQVLFPLFILAVAFVAAALITSSRASAQSPKFKVGDRVEVDTFMRSNWRDPANDKNAVWRIGTVTEIYSPESQFGGYIIKMDEDRREMRIRFVDTQWIRTPQGTDSKTANDNKTPDERDANQNPTNTSNGIVSCEKSDDLSGSSQSTLFKRLIFNNLDHKVPATIHFINFTVGATHPYHRQVDNPDGPLGVEGRTVYPVKASYRVCWEYSDSLIKDTFEDMRFACLRTQTGEWVCGGTHGKEPTKHERVRK